MIPCGAVQYVQLSYLPCQEESRTVIFLVHYMLMSSLNYEQVGNFRKDLALAYKTLGVVFGGLVTSPLYVYPSMNLSSPTKDDYMGLYSIMFWTLTLIGVVKYVGIALNADDHGEGNYRAHAAFLEFFFFSLWPCWKKP